MCLIGLLGEIFITRDWQDVCAEVVTLGCIVLNSIACVFFAYVQSKCRWLRVRPNGVRCG